jgi:hypothetical protein
MRILLAALAVLFVLALGSLEIYAERAVMAHVPPGSTAEILRARQSESPFVQPPSQGRRMR